MQKPTLKFGVEPITLQITGNYRKDMKEMADKFGYQNYANLMDDIVHTYLNRNRQRMTKVIDRTPEGTTAVTVQLTRKNFDLLKAYCSVQEISLAKAILAILRDAIQNFKSLNQYDLIQQIDNKENESESETSA
jgi:hypothetical protein